jgi:hypothetical protein
MPPSIRPRTDWEDPKWPVTGPEASAWLVEAIVVHYPGVASKLPTTDAGVIARLRNEQRSTLDRKPDGYSLGYNWEIDTRGVVWEVRGADIRCAANGSSTWNLRTVAVQLQTDGDKDCTDAQVDAMRELVAWLRTVYARPLPLVGHRQVRGMKWPLLNPGPNWGTSCPGPALAVRLATHSFEPLPAPPPKPQFPAFPPPKPNPTITVEGDERVKNIRWNRPDAPGHNVGLVYDGVHLKHVGNGHAAQANIALYGSEIVWGNDYKAVEMLEGLIKDSVIVDFAGGVVFGEPVLDTAWQSRTGIVR